MLFFSSIVFIDKVILKLKNQNVVIQLFVEIEKTLLLRSKQWRQSIYELFILCKNCKMLNWWPKLEIGVFFSEDYQILEVYITCRCIIILLYMGRKNTLLRNFLYHRNVSLGSSQPDPSSSDLCCGELFGICQFCYCLSTSFDAVKESKALEPDTPQPGSLLS